MIRRCESGSSILRATTRIQRTQFHTCLIDGATSKCFFFLSWVCWLLFGVGIIVGNSNNRLDAKSHSAHITWHTRKAAIIPYNNPPIRIHTKERHAGQEHSTTIGLFIYGKYSTPRRYAYSVHQIASSHIPLSHSGQVITFHKECRTFHTQFSDWVRWQNSWMKQQKNL